MVSSAAKTVASYLAELPPERRAVISTVRDLVNGHLPGGYVETMNWGMICWEIPLSRYPVTYNKQPLSYAALAAQKNNFAIYLMGVHAESREEDGLRSAYARAGKKLDMGKCCLRFKSLEGLLQDEVAKVIAATSVEDYIARYEASRAPSASRAAAKTGGAKAVVAAKKVPVKKSKIATKSVPARTGVRAVVPAKGKAGGEGAKATKKVAKEATRRVAGKTLGKTANAAVEAAASKR